MITNADFTNSGIRSRVSTPLRMACCSAALFCVLTGCKTAPATADDATLTRNLQSQLASDSSISGQPIQGNISNGVATLTGSVANDAQRTIAARDAAGIPGVKQVINNLMIGTPPPASAAIVTPPVAPLPAPPVPLKRSAIVPPARPDDRNQGRRDDRQPAPIERPQPQPSQQVFNNVPPPPPPPPAQAQPVFRNVTVPSGNSLPVRITQTLDSATAQEGQTFSGTVASDIVIDGIVAIPAGSAVSGRVDAVQEAAHFKGASLLTVSLSSLSRRGDRMPLSTEPYTVEGKGRGKNTAEKAGGGAAVGAILGGIFGGGKGAAIGAATGGGLGAGANAITRGQQVQITSETVVRFRLASPINVRVRTDAGASDRSRDSRDNTYRDNQTSDPTLQHRPN